MSTYRYLATRDESGQNFVARAQWYIALDTIQQEIIDWQVKNFGHVPYTQPLMGMTEEVGELQEAEPEMEMAGLPVFIGRLHHAFLKQEQGIRGTEAEHQAAARDAVGDLLVYTMALCQLRGWRLSDIIEETWLKVQQRDWQKDKLKGVTG